MQYLYFIVFAIWAAQVAATAPLHTVVVIGSINADVIVPIEDFPALGETIVSRDTEDAGLVIAGGKGANQAVSCSRLGIPTKFICNFGNDGHSSMLKQTLIENSVDISECLECKKPSGLGLVFLKSDGAGSAIVVGGANAAWPVQLDTSTPFKSENGVACLMLQMEVPQFVNDAYATAACAAGIPVFQDVGGADRDIPDDHLKRCSFVSPNLTELKRLTKMPTNTEEEIIEAAKSLQSRGARNVLVTLGSEGSLLLTGDGEIIREPSCPVEQVVDETGAGDNYRAAFVVARFVERKSLCESMAFAAASGAVAVSKLGAIPACSTREECLTALGKAMKLRGGETETSPGGGPFPYKFASRLNSMKDRADLWEEGDVKTVTGWIARQGKVKGLDFVDFNYPQHLKSPVNDVEKEGIVAALGDAGLKCGAICLRFPKGMQLGAYTHPDRQKRQRAIELTKEACEWARALGANEVVVWSAFCGYDYSLQVEYNQLWDDVVTAFQDVCDAFPDIKVSLEYKPTDENTRFFAVPSTGAAMLLMNEINRENFGLTLDFGHCLMAGENPAQSVAMVNRRNDKLFGVQLGDGYGRLGAEDGLAFGSVHPLAALEFVTWLIRTNFKGHIYFDTFPRNEDPVRECEYNIRQFKSMYFTAKKLLEGEHGRVLEECMKNHDAMGVLELLEQTEEIKQQTNNK